MRVLTLTEAAQADFGEVIPAFKGKVSKAWKRNEGDNAYGRWTIQSLEMIDDSGGKLVAKLMNRDEFPPGWIGKVVVFESAPDKKGKLAGLEVVKNDRNVKPGDPPKKEWHVKGGAIMSLQDGQAAPETGHEPPQGQNSSPGGVASATPDAKRESAGLSRADQLRAEAAAIEEQRKAKEAADIKASEAAKAQKRRSRMLEVIGQHRRDALDFAVELGIIPEGGKLEDWPDAKLPASKEAMEDIMRSIDLLRATRVVDQASTFLCGRLNGYRMILDMVDYLGEERKSKGKPLTPEHLQAIASTLFISGDRAGQFMDLPVADFDKFWKSKGGAK